MSGGQGSPRHTGTLACHSDTMRRGADDIQLAGGGRDARETLRAAGGVSADAAYNGGRIRGYRDRGETINPNTFTV